MRASTVLKIGDFPPHVEAMLEREFTCRVWDEVQADESLRESVRAIVMRSNFRVEPAMMDALPNLGVIATSGVGYDGIPVGYAKVRGIQVANTPDVLNAAVAELAIGLLIGFLRRIPAADRYVREGRWVRAPFPLTRDLAGQRVGIVGLGRIGKEIARRLEVFGVSLAYYGPSDKHVQWRYEADLVALAKECDSLIVTAPATADTKGLISARVLDALGAEGCLINIARGSLVDEQALLRALEDKRWAGAALDVFQGEPDIDPRFLALENVILTPHMGSATRETRTIMARLAIDNIKSFLATGKVMTPVHEMTG